MTFDEVLESITLKFTSDNDVPVERITLIREEWEIIFKELCDTYEKTGKI